MPTISNLPYGSTPQGPEVFAIDQGGETRRIQLSDLFQSGGTEKLTSLAFSNGVLSYTDELGVQKDITIDTVAPGTVTGSSIVDNSITNVQISPNTITNTEILNETISYTKLSNGAPEWNTDGDLLVDRHVIAGVNTTGDLAGGKLGLMLNDGGGNASVAFNHTFSTPDIDGNAGRITVNVDRQSDEEAKMTFALKSNVISGENTDLFADSLASLILYEDRIQLGRPTNIASEDIISTTSVVNKQYVDEFQFGTSSIQDEAITYAKLSPGAPRWDATGRSTYFPGDGTDGGLRINYDATGDGESWIDFHSTDDNNYDARIHRQEGQNGDFKIDNVGEGDVKIAADAKLRFHAVSGLDSNNEIETRTILTGGWVSGSGSSYITLFSGEHASRPKEISYEASLHTFQTDYSETAFIDEYGDINAKRHIISGFDGEGQVALTVNDGYGNANVAFNHTKGVPDINGSSARIETAVEANVSKMIFELGDNATAGSALPLTTVLTLQTDKIEFFQPPFYDGSQVATLADITGTEFNDANIPDGSIGHVKLTDGAPEWDSERLIIPGNGEHGGLEINQDLTQEGISYIDFHSSVDGRFETFSGTPDYNARIQKGAGVDGEFVINNMTGGNFAIRNQNEPRISLVANQKDDNEEDVSYSGLTYIRGGTWNNAGGEIILHGPNHGGDSAKPGEIVYRAENHSFRDTDNNVFVEVTKRGYLTVGELGTGQVALTVNDGKGNANITFNHTRGRPDAFNSNDLSEEFNSGRITVNTDESSNPAHMRFQVKGGMLAIDRDDGVIVDLPTILELKQDSAHLYKNTYVSSVDGNDNNSVINKSYLDNTLDNISINSAQIGNGVVTPDKLSSGGPSWDEDGILSVKSHLRLNSDNDDFWNYIDFNSSSNITTNPEARLVRYVGDNGTLDFLNYGTGNFNLRNNDSAKVRMVGGLSGHLALSGGDGDTGGMPGANIELYGPDHENQANKAFYDANKHTFRNVLGSSNTNTDKSVTIDLEQGEAGIPVMEIRDNSTNHRATVKISSYTPSIMLEDRSTGKLDYQIAVDDDSFKISNGLLASGSSSELSTKLFEITSGDITAPATTVSSDDSLTTREWCYDNLALAANFVTNPNSLEIRGNSDESTPWITLYRNPSIDEDTKNIVHHANNHAFKNLDEELMLFLYGPYDNVNGTKTDGVSLQVTNSTTSTSGNAAISVSSNKSKGGASTLFFDHNNQNDTTGPAARIWLGGDSTVTDEWLNFAVGRDAEKYDSDRAFSITPTGVILIGTDEGSPYNDTTGTGIAIHSTGSNDHGLISVKRSTAPCADFNLTGGASEDIIRFRYQGAEVGAVHTDGSFVSLTGTSDHRLKEEITPLDGGIDRLKQLNPVKYKWKKSGAIAEGFIAHEFQEVVPDGVTGSKDEVDENGNPVYQQIDKSTVIPLLTKALQEAITKIEELEARIATLEA